MAIFFFFQIIFRLWIVIVITDVSLSISQSIWSNPNELADSLNLFKLKFFTVFHVGCLSLFVTSFFYHNEFKPEFTPTKQM